MRPLNKMRRTAVAPGKVFGATPRRLSSVITATLCSLMIASGCGRGSPTPEPPLRPLLYTEPVAGASSTIEGYEEWNHPSDDPVSFPGSFQSQPGELPAESRKLLSDTPANAIRSIMDTLRSGTPEELDSLVPAAELLDEKLRLSPEGAAERAQEIRDSLRQLYADIHPLARPEYRRSNWSSLLQITQVDIGPPRAVDGSIVEPAAADMYDTNRASIHLVGTDVDFLIRFPRLFKDDHGQWRIGASPSTSDNYRRLLELGYDQKPELMESDQAGLPFRKGNYWDYQIEHKRDGVWTERRGRGFRDSVEEIEDRNLYRVITLRRTFRSPDRPDQRRVFLQTPTRLFPCDGSCVRAADSLDALLRRLRNLDPLVVFPIDPTETTGTSSEDTRPSTARVDEQYEVPFGVFDKAFKFHRGGTEHDPDIYVRAGIGVLSYEWREAGVLQRAALRSMRILR